MLYKYCIVIISIIISLLLIHTLDDDFIPPDFMDICCRLAHVITS